MPTWPTALGGMLFAGYAATQAQKAGLDSPTSFVTSAIRNLGDGSTFGSASVSGRSGMGGGSELTVLQGEVDRLHKLLSDVVRGQKSGGPLVIHTGRGTWFGFMFPILLAGGGVTYAYCWWHGISVTDWFMVTNKSLQQFRNLVSESMTQLWEEMRKQKDEFVARISAVGQQQQQLMAAQGEMDEKLTNVKANVDEIRDISNSIETRVGQMDHTMNLMSSGVQRANEGIYLLCAAVAEVTRRVGMDNSRLKTYVQSTPPELTEANPGLRTLLQGFESGPAPAIAGPTGVITEVSSVDSEPELPSPGGGRGIAGQDMKVLYRRDSAAAPAASASGRGLIGGLWGSSNGSANRSRTPANAH
ncbi:hypothetical protein HYH03_003938 [Edaphochlamys debaryana]|uniref:DUF1664 domain-containing protein n=1 Tax=Edaphochlamys debaryana TaxID=47281 RepID=A0A835Y8V1_9CHLO|nr:hypothetical protein HYH03_003938 [Edaphochlamys debaryana]|eukprot:KAG2498183.1 hypothetical protein HYH03_003938 [Edaphochlamys debaryana]